MLNNVVVPEKIKSRLTYDPAILLLYIYTKELEMDISTDIYTSMFTAALFATARRWKQHKYPHVYMWVNEQCSIYLQ